MPRIASVIAAVAAVALTGCQGGGTATADDGAAGDSAAAPARQASAGAMPAGWDATDACSIIDKAVMADILKTEVTEAKLDMVHRPDGVTAATSQCSYTLAGGGSAALMTRWSPIADNTAESIAATRSAGAAAVKAFTDRPVEDVPGVGKAAFFVPGINQFNVFLDDSRMVIITLASAPNDKARDMAVALARKAGA
jgi:hypothetical protein